jgi:hypothetical protein
LSKSKPRVTSRDKRLAKQTAFLLDRIARDMNSLAQLAQHAAERARKPRARTLGMWPS